MVEDEVDWIRKSNNITGMKHNNCEVRAQCKVIKTADCAVEYECLPVDVMFTCTYIQASIGITGCVGLPQLPLLLCTRRRPFRARVKLSEE